MFRHVLQLTILAAAEMVLAGCATPQVALDQANLGVSMMGGLQTSLEEYRQTEAALEALRLDSLANRRRALAAVSSAPNSRLRAYVSAGDTWVGQAASQLVADANALADEDKQAADAAKAIDQMVATLLAPLPSTAAAMTSAQSKLAVLGAESSASTKRAEALVFLKEIGKNVESNRAKIKKAQEDAAKAAADKAKTSTSGGS